MYGKDIGLVISSNSSCPIFEGEKSVIFSYGSSPSVAKVSKTAPLPAAPRGPPAEANMIDRQPLGHRLSVNRNAIHILLNEVRTRFLSAAQLVLLVGEQSLDIFIPQLKIEFEGEVK